MLAFLLAALPLFTTTTSSYFSANYLWHRNEPNRIEAAMAHTLGLTEWMDVSVNGRLGLTHTRWHTLEWSSELYFPLDKYFTPRLRIGNVSHLAHGTHHFGVLATAGTRTPDLFGTHFFLDLGLFKRWVSLSTSMPIPFWGGVSYTEYDIAAAIGLRGRVADVYAWEVRASNFDDLDTHNFNQPLLQLSLARENVADKSQWSVFFRNDFLLGFGLQHSYRVGAAYRMAM